MTLDFDSITPVLWRCVRAWLSFDIVDNRIVKVLFVHYFYVFTFFEQ
jgi:hypothetical protein